MSDSCFCGLVSKFAFFCQNLLFVAYFLSVLGNLFLKSPRFSCINWPLKKLFLGYISRENCFGVKKWRELNQVWHEPNDGVGFTMHQRDMNQMMARGENSTKNWCDKKKWTKSWFWVEMTEMNQLSLFVLGGGRLFVFGPLEIVSVCSFASVILHPEN